MAWVPLLTKHTLGADITFSSDAVTLDSESRVSATPENENPWWVLGVAEGLRESLRLRITVDEYHADGGNPGEQYRAGRFSYGDGSNVYNEAAPSSIPGGDPDGYFDDPAEVVAFSPAVIEFDESTWADGAELAYNPAIATGDNIPMTESYSMLVEVWDEGGTGNCFWTDLVAVTQDCGG